MSIDWRDLLADFPDADLTMTCNRWLRPVDAFAKGAPWWQWRDRCDCPDTTFGRNPHRWDCVLTPIWEQTIRELGGPYAVDGRPPL